MLGHFGARGALVAPNWVPLVLDPLGACFGVSERASRAVLYLLILNNDGIKAVRTGECLGSSRRETQPGAPAQASSSTQWRMPTCPR